MGRDKGRPSQYRPTLELYFRQKYEGGGLRDRGELRWPGSAASRQHCLVLIHGFRNTDGEAAHAYQGFRDRQEELAERATWSEVVRELGDAFWPGDADYWSFLDAFDALVYPEALKKGLRTASLLAEAIRSIPGLVVVDFIAHSLGCRVTLETVKNLFERGGPHVGRMCLMAAAIPSEDLEPGGRYFSVMQGLSGQGTRIHVMHSRADSVLQWAFPPGQRLAGKEEASNRALGRYGPTPQMPGAGGTVTETAVGTAGHGDYWGHNTKSGAAYQSARASGQFLQLHSRSRQGGEDRSIETRRLSETSRSIDDLRRI